MPTKPGAYAGGLHGGHDVSKVTLAIEWDETWPDFFILKNPGGHNVTVTVDEETEQ